VSAQKIEPLNAAEATWVAAELRNAADIVARYSPADAQRASTLGALDRTYEAFSAHADRTDGAAANGVINALGICFGQHLVRELGLEWAAVTDEYGCELAVVGMRGKGDFVVFPTNFVAKRWERGEVGFFVDSCRRIAEQYAELRAQWEGR
jgi:hypothetical protein